MQEIKQIVNKAITEQVMTNCYVSSVDFTKNNNIHCYTYQAGNSSKNIFDLASLTKALVTTPLIFSEVLLKDRDLNANIRTWLKDCETGLNDNLLDLKICDLLAHRAGLKPWKNFWIECNEEKNIKDKHKLIEQRCTDIAISPTPIDKDDVYSDIGFILLGYVLEKIFAKPLNTVFKEFCRFVLGFEHQDFGYSSNIDKTKVIPTSFCNIRQRRLIAEVHDENCFALDSVTGHAGLFASGEALTEYLQALVESPFGELFLGYQFKPENIINKKISNISLGWRIADDNFSKVFKNGTARGHLGFTGTSFWITKDLKCGILLTNRVYKSRFWSGIANFRKVIYTNLDKTC